jgi:hypothetical protein
MDETIEGQVQMNITAFRNKKSKMVCSIIAEMKTTDVFCTNKPYIKTYTDFIIFVYKGRCSFVLG